MELNWDLKKMRDANLACPDKKRWKKLQSSPDATVYADRNANSAWLPMMRRQDWKYSVAVTIVGRRDCTLDDVFFAVITPDAVTRRRRIFLMDQRPRKSDQVVPIEVSTQEAPFQFLGVTRFLSPHIWPFPVFKSPREMVMAFATGGITTANGKRYAYEMAQSVELRCKGAPNSLILRSRAVQARIFWEQRDGSIAVYSKLILDVKNCLSDSMKRIMLCRTVMEFWKLCVTQSRNEKVVVVCEE
ncbi:unnamed protein product [Peronospora destructor]|uniref:Uncharacterized protein n=1 Tax=Peronospora destructor TaxID=86335 RepID=A0AAV0UK71_9STRA|nr:unnamed protein product [Peronospora destructor]